MTAVAPSIVVPRLKHRSADELQRVVAKYAGDAIAELGAGPTGPTSFSAADLEWTARHATSSFADIEITTLRIVARNHAGNVHQAAALLGLSHVGLGKWFKIRKLA